jgi:hypothetical protein
MRCEGMCVSFLICAIVFACFSFVYAMIAGGEVRMWKNAINKSSTYTTSTYGAAMSPS